MSVTTKTRINSQPTSIGVLKNLRRLERVGSKLVFSYCLTSRIAEVRQDGEVRHLGVEPEVRRHYAEVADFAASDQMVAANSIYEFNCKRRSRGYVTGTYTLRLEQKTKIFSGGSCKTKTKLTIKRVS